MEASSIFRKRARERMGSPDELDRYLRVANPVAWLVLAAVAILLAALLVWGVLGDVSYTVSASAVSHGGETFCFLEEQLANRVHAGDDAIVGGVRATVRSVSEIPYSKEEVTGLSDYIVDSIFTGKWGYRIDFDVSGGDTALAQDVPLDVAITTERLSPMQLAMGGGD